MAQAFSQSNQQPPASATDDPMAKLAQLKRMYEADLITATEYEAKKQAILAAF
jgi:hypothetical protein